MAILPTPEEARRWMQVVSDPSVHFEMTIDGNEVPGVLDVTFGARVAPDPKTGVPVDARVRLTPLTILRRAQPSVEPFDWAAAPWMENEKQGVITFFDPSMEGRAWKTVEWKGICTGYREWVPDVNAHRDMPQMEIIRFSARFIRLSTDPLVEWKAGGNWPEGTEE